MCLLMACNSGKLSIDLLQVDCQNLFSTGLLQVVSTSCNKSANEKSYNEPDFNLLGTKLLGRTFYISSHCSHKVLHIYCWEYT